MFLMFCIILIASAVDSKTDDMPPFVPKCSLNDPQLGNCISQAANSLRPYIRNGIEEIGLPKLQPLIVSRVSMNQESPTVNYTSTWWNYTLRGGDNFDITNVKYNPKTTSFTVNIQFDPISVNSDYEANGKFLQFIPFNGKGKINIGFGPINATVRIFGNVIKRKGVEYYNVTNVKIQMNINGGSMYATGFINEDLERTNLINEAINRNSQVILDGVTPAFESVAEAFTLRYFKWLTRKYPLYTLFSHS